MNQIFALSTRDYSNEIQIVSSNKLNIKSNEITQIQYQDYLFGRIPREHPDFNKCQQYYTQIQNNSRKYKQQDQNCSICFCVINITQKIELYCGHLFDTNCIEKWVIEQQKINKLPSCPVCRKII